MVRNRHRAAVPGLCPCLRLYRPRSSRPALALARRVMTEAPDSSDEDRLGFAFRLCLAREPREAEVRVLRQLLERQREAGLANPAAVKLLVGNFPVPADCSAAELAAWYAVATALLNLDETITKG